LCIVPPVGETGGAVRFVEARTLLHAGELQANGDHARDNQALLPIEPLA
jgi:hypothetical protein